MTQATRAEVEFHGECVRGAIQLKDVIGHNPSRFSKMVAEHGGREAVRLLLKGDPSDGFTTLWEAGRLEMSVEAMVLPWYEQLFTDDERTKAQRRFVDRQFDIDSLTLVALGAERRGAARQALRSTEPSA